jgi:hypothetical protein
MASSRADVGLRMRWPRWCPRPHDRRGACCAHIGDPPPDRPDLATYSQEEQLTLGVSPTWDNPDMLTNWWRPFTLMPETVVTVRNLSSRASAVNAHVSLSTSIFGLGMPRVLLGMYSLSLAPSQQRTVLFPLPQATLNAPDQRIGTYVRIDHPHDARAINNAGQQLLADAFTTSSGRAFTVTFPVRNPLGVSQAITLAALANDLSAVVMPGSHLFAPLEQRTATLGVSVPGTLHGTVPAPLRRDVTIVGRNQDGTLLGGLTYVIWIDD